MSASLADGRNQSNGNAAHGAKQCHGGRQSSKALSKAVTARQYARHACNAMLPLLLVMTSK